METVNVKPHQCLMDLSMQRTGSINALFDFALANGISITDDLVSGSALWAPDVEIADRRTFQTLKDEQVIPANGYTLADEAVVKTGMGYMAIQVDFRVS
ncbi:hypothetical protein F0L74_00890 [Chitinophaga agrisoli]|uniref:Uncharacterized protein n=1 Tax=Chitinophaga agrisoli TaxID=2607653 RepID=A0A5B2W0C8_9BACT|nr:hypothetical protein [Chitinophaga agrisoli]KAA2244564.1 hypothetical protein F0L74_00890 [Chitinophaga agrisoli]